jgi:hypothetical protein
MALPKICSVIVFVLVTYCLLLLAPFHIYEKKLLHVHKLQKTPRAYKFASCVHKLHTLHFLLHVLIFIHFLLHVFIPGFSTVKEKNLLHVFISL